MIDPKHFRDVLGSYPTGVCVITSIDETGQRWGLAVGTFSSISLDPPLVGFLPDKRSQSWSNIAPTGRFCVNVLGCEQLDGTSPGGLPILDGALAWIECAIEQVVELGDHLLVVGAVQAMERNPDGSPLIFYRGGYHRLVDLEDATA